MFKDASEGDKVWSIEYGWGKVICVDSFGIYVSFSITEQWYTYDGKNRSTNCYSYSSFKPTLFWDEVKFDVPPKPVPKVEKWLWVYKGTGVYHVTTSYYSEKDVEAISYMNIIEKLEFTKRLMKENQHCV